ncbi:MAG: hypothetical protein P8O16_18620 [Algoriphagus sp.]|jgi:hypothetical protein|uniref:YfaP family protein n=1 Tax=Algoriphagus sp. TaxID=1872435 RepID=UPI0026240B62|nr:hypothetical protein [Algoriphagus sp.]MDG1279299.1 hypothetical protein [Algoriphagus sp.]
MAKNSIQVFSISFLDLLSGALGAVIILYVIVPKMPVSEEEFERQAKVAELVDQFDLNIDQLADYVSPDVVEEFKRLLESVENELNLLSEENNRLQRSLDEANQNVYELGFQLDDARQVIANQSQQIEKFEGEGKFALVTMSWDTDDTDVDLHILAPWGDEFYYEKKKFPNRPGELTKDNTEGPGLEIWEIYNPPPGTYEIKVKIYDRKGNNQNPNVKVNVFHRNGIKNFPPVILTSASGDFNQAKVLVGKITIPESGEITVQ